MAEFLEKLIRDQIAAGHIPGASYIIGSGKKVIRGEIGSSDVSKPEKTFTTNTIVRIMSMTKSLVCAGLMLCVDDGLVSLTDPLSKYIPEFAKMTIPVLEKDVKPGQVRVEPGEGVKVPEGFVLVEAQKPIILKQLLQHTSGMVGSVDPLNLLQTPSEKAASQTVANSTPTLYVFACEGQRGIPLADHVKNISRFPLGTEPGTRFIYSHGIDVAGRVIEVVSGKPLPVFLRERLFEPCCMPDTGFSVPLAKLDRLAGMQASFDAVKKASMFPLPYEDFALPGFGAIPTTASYVDDGVKPLPFPQGSGGGVSTAEDYFNYTQMLLNDGMFNGKRVMSKSSVKLLMAPSQYEFLSPAGTVFPSLYAALGGGVIPPSGISSMVGEGAYYWGGFYTTVFLVDQKNNASGVVMSQCLQDLEKVQRFFQFGLDALARSYLDA